MIFTVVCEPMFYDDDGHKWPELTVKADSTEEARAVASRKYYRETGEKCRSAVAFPLHITQKEK